MLSACSIVRASALVQRFQHLGMKARIIRQPPDDGGIARIHDLVHHHGEGVVGQARQSHAVAHQRRRWAAIPVLLMSAASPRSTLAASMAVPLPSPIFLCGRHDPQILGGKAIGRAEHVSPEWISSGRFPALCAAPALCAGGLPPRTACPPHLPRQGFARELRLPLLDALQWWMSRLGVAARLETGSARSTASSPASKKRKFSGVRPGGSGLVAAPARRPRWPSPPAPAGAAPPLRSPPPPPSPHRPRARG